MTDDKTVLVDAILPLRRSPYRIAAIGDSRAARIAG
jgi:hypothetical protein